MRPETLSPHLKNRSLMMKTLDSNVRPHNKNYIQLTKSTLQTNYNDIEGLHELIPTIALNSRKSTPNHKKSKSITRAKSKDDFERKSSLEMNDIQVLTPTKFNKGSTKRSPVRRGSSVDKNNFIVKGSSSIYQSNLTQNERSRVLNESKDRLTNNSTEVRSGSWNLREYSNGCEKYEVDYIKKELYIHHQKQKGKYHDLVARNLKYKTKVKTVEKELNYARDMIEKNRTNFGVDT